MLISHRLKFLIIGIPKTASNSHRISLNKYVDVWAGSKKSTLQDPEKFYQHDTLPVIKDKFILHGWNINEYFKYAIIRNPWQRYASYYMWAKSNKKEMPNLNHIFSIHNSQPHKILEIFINNNISQDNYLLVDNKEFVDYIARLETINEDFEKLCDHLNIDQIHLSHKNKSEQYDYRDLYNQELIDLVYHKEKYIIEKYNYSFE